VYVGGDLKDPARTLPRALMLGTVLVTAVYVALNAAFVLAVPIETVRGEVAIAERVVDAIAGPTVARLLAVAIALGLVSTVGAFVLSGTRVYLAIARDLPRLAFLGRTRAGGVPIVALAVQAALAAVLVVTSTLRDLLGAVGMALSITSALVVVALFVERRRLARRGERPAFPAPGYPLTPLLYLGLLTWVVIAGSIERPALLAISLATLGLGAVGFAVFREKPQ
jgi:basic amino acid/polyamine antiporter, APA family